MTSQVARTEAMLRERCYAINDSVLVNFSSTVSTFSVLNHVGSSDTDGKILYKCQENFIGFRFGKLLERLYQEYPEKVAVARAKGYYRELQRMCPILKACAWLLSFTLMFIRRVEKTGKNLLHVLLEHFQTLQ